MAFLQSKPLISLATGYTGCDTNIERELDLSVLIYEPNEYDTARSDDAAVPALSQGTQMPIASYQDRNIRLLARALVLLKMLTNVVVR